ncbi:2'-5' RNA ligase family protein [Nonomuraea sp. NPDC005983]|uniref:2'-5' RNA ligase family protein n=1 Tax=Nonomuraea sp. NPDC005983 TaxID=3155595 RepID=UPI0033B66B5B
MSAYPVGETALVVNVPAAEPVVASWRERYDRSAAYGVCAHVTVLVPFLHRDRLDDAVMADLRELFAAREPFDVRFERTARFPGLLYLAPQPDTPLRELTDMVVRRWPEAPPYGGKYDEVVPHLTVADTDDADTLAAIEAALTLPVTARVSGVTLLVFDGTAWRAEAFFPLGELPPTEFAFPGPLRDKLVAAILSGEKTATTGLLADYEHSGDPLPSAGQWSAVLDSNGRPVALIESVEVRVLPIRAVDDAFAQAEGEGYATAAEWRAGHERFWQGPEMTAFLGHTPVIDDDTLVVTERFRVLEQF